MKDFEFYKTIRVSNKKDKIIKAFSKLHNFYNKIPDTKGCMENINTSGASCKAWCCCLPYTRIYTDKGLLPIKDLNIGDMVYNKSGKFSRILNVASKMVDEEIVSISSCYGRKIKLTKDHMVLVDSFKRKNREKVNDPIWIEAKDLIPKVGSNQMGHYLIFPKYFSIEEKRDICISDFAKNIFVEGDLCYASKSKRGKSISNSLKLDYDFCWIIGMFLAEGTNGRDIIEFHINSDEQYIYKKIQKFSEDMGLSCSSKTNRGKSFSVRICSRVLSDFFENLCGKGCDKKRIHEDFYSYIIKNKELRDGLHDGYYAGDGTKKLQKKCKYSVVTTSEDLHYQIMMLNWMNDEIPVSFIGYPKDKKKTFTLNISDGKFKDYVETEKDFRVPIRKIDFEHYSGLVYDIEVENEHSFYTECGEIHNCKIQTPQLLYSEFLLLWHHVSKNWTDEEICDLFEKCMTNAVNPVPSKGCVFFDRDTCMCKAHKVRPYNCRIYGITPNEDFEPRYKRLKEEYKSIPGAVIKPQCSLVSPVDDVEVTKEEIDTWWEELVEIEISIGIPNDMVSDAIGGSYRTPHDHVLIYNMPENVLNALSGIKQYTDEFEKKRAIKELVQVISNVFKNKS
jgi:Fe-S-cluster containining protein